MKKVFIDGSAGTTGLRIKERLTARNDLELIVLPEEYRKDECARKEAINESDVSILCLPDEAAKEAVSFVTNPETIIIDTSTAHRTSPEFTYGFPEISGLKETIKKSKRIANPGCHASGVIALVEPLVEKGLLSKDVLLSSFSLTGYSGGGKKMIGEYVSENRPSEFEAPRMYGVNQNHKHLPEIQKVCQLTIPPVFCPIVAPYYAGMEVIVPIFKEWTNANIGEIKQVYKDYYANGLVHFIETEDNFLSACELSGFDDMEVSVLGNEDRILLVSRFDNLGKGASGSAIQNLNICLGLEETLGLNLKFGGNKT